MLPHTFSGRGASRSLFAWLAAACALVAAKPLQHAAAEPQAVNPLPTPWFSIDPQSPTIAPNLRPADVLTKPGPFVVRAGSTMGLTNPLDDLDALSTSRGDISAGQTFMVLFGIDRNSVGAEPPDPGLVAQNRPYNALDQAAKRQAAGDIFMALTPFNRAGPLLPFGPGTFNNTLVKNQGDTGGVDKDLKPEVSPEESLEDDEAIDDSDAISEDPEPGVFPFGPRGAPAIDVLFFSATRNSPSLVNLPGTAGGANVYGDFEPGSPNGEFLFAAAQQLGLVPGPAGDDIDSLVVFDNGDLILTPNVDVIIFTLSRDSPTVLEGLAGPADLLLSRGNGQFQLWAAAEVLGLAHTDNVDGLEILPTNNVPQEIFQRAIFRVLPGDYDGNGQLDDVDCQEFVNCYQGADISYDTNGTSTWTVSVGPGAAFNPPSITIEAGDTVNWLWADGPHNVVSGPFGAPDGAFNSGAPVSTPGHIFTVTFDAALLDLFPKFQSRYTYHSMPNPGMIGMVDVNDHPCSVFDLDFDLDVDCDDWHKFRELAAADGEACPLLTIPEFVAVLLGMPQAPAHTCLADMNDDGNADGRDVQPFVNALLGL